MRDLKIVFKDVEQDIDFIFGAIPELFELNLTGL